MPACYYAQSDAGGVIWIFLSVGAAGEGRHIAVKGAGQQGCAKTTARLKKNIAKPKKAKKPTGRPRTAAGTDKIKKNIKTWMMPLQHPGLHGLRR